MDEAPPPNTPSAGAGTSPSRTAASAVRASAPRFRFGGGYSYYGSRLVFSNGEFVSITSHALPLFFEAQLTPKWTLSLGAGLLANGRAWFDAGGSMQLTGGFVGSVSASYRILDPTPKRPIFLLGSLQLATTVAATKWDDDGMPATVYTAVDIRGALTFGGVIANVFTPYIAGRVFGGPVLYEFRGATQLGTDIYHVQIALGASLRLPGGADVYVEGTPLWSLVGERRLAVGLGMSF